MSQPPEPPTVWNGRFLAAYPDGTVSDYDLKGHMLRPGDELPGGWILDQYSMTDRPVAEGKYMVVGILRKAEKTS